jgi:hypothetical protein
MTYDALTMQRIVQLREALFTKSAEDLSSLRERILPELHGRLWHTTHLDRFKRILVESAILPEPDIPDNQRYCTGLGKDHYPYVRAIGGVSLFDFDQFDPDAYSAMYPSSTWATFIPYREDWGHSVWIEIDRERVASQLILGPALLDKWKSENALGHNIMPIIEAAHLGAIPRQTFRQAFLVSKDVAEFRPLSIVATP